MSIIDASKELDKSLRPFPWYHSCAVGEVKNFPTIYVYLVRKIGTKTQSNIPNEINGFPVITKVTGKFFAA